MLKEILRPAEIIFDHGNINDPNPLRSDVIIIPGTPDTLGTERAIEEYHKGKSPYLLFTGKGGRNGEYLKTNKSEAKILADIAIKKGVPEEVILLEEESTNTGQNFTFSYELLLNKEMIAVDSLIVAHMPYSLRKDYLIFRKKWPEPQPQIYMCAPNVGLEEYHIKGFQGRMTLDDVINDMMGDLQRTKVWADKKFLLREEIPAGVKEAYYELVDRGYTKQLLTDEGGKIIPI